MNNVNKIVVENIKCKNNINPRKVIINFFICVYSILFKGRVSPIFSIKEYLKIEINKILSQQGLRSVTQSSKFGIVAHQNPGYHKQTVSFH